MTETLSKEAIQSVACTEAMAADTGLKEITLVPWGAVKTKKGTFIVDEESARNIVDAFEQHKTPLPIDYEHQTLGGVYSAPNGRAPAAGWITRIWSEPQIGIRGFVSWTDDARTSIRKREYQFLSPVVVIRNSDRRAVELHSAALTNKPAIPAMDRLAATQTMETESMQTKDKVVLALADGTLNQDIRNALVQLKQTLAMDGEQSPIDILKRAIAQIKALQGTDSNAKEGDAAVAASVREILGLDAKASKAEVVLAMTVGDGKGASAELRAMKEAEADRIAQERVDKYVALNVLNPNMKASMDAALELAKTAPDRFEAIMDATAPYAQPGRTKPPSSRSLAIGDAIREFKADPSHAKSTSAQAFVSMKLQDAGYDRLSDDEAKELPRELSIA